MENTLEIIQDNDVDIDSSYLAEINSSISGADRFILSDCLTPKPFTAEEERYYTTKYYETKDKKYRDIIVQHNTRLAYAIAKKFSRSNTEKALDYFQEGCIGLLVAIDNYNPTMGYRFSTYATWWIKQKIIRYVQSNDIIRFPVHTAELYNKVKRLRDELNKEGKDSSIKVLSEKLDIPEERIQYLDNISSLASLDIELNVEGDGRNNSTLGDMIEDKSVASLDDNLIRENFRNDILKFLDNLDWKDRDKAIIIRRFGFYDGRAWTLEELGNSYGLTRERVRQIEGKFIKKLRRASYKLGLQDYKGAFNK